MNDIDNELLAKRILGWERFQETTTGRWLWHDHKGHTRCQLANFAEDPAVCMELIDRFLGKHPYGTVSICGGIRDKTMKSCGITDCDSPIPVWGFDTEGELLSVIAAAFTAMLKDMK